MDNHSGSEVPDPIFSKIRALDLPPEAVVSRQIRDALAKVDEKLPHPWQKTIGMWLTMVPLALWAAVANEMKILELQKELDQLRGRS